MQRYPLVRELFDAIDGLSPKLRIIARVIGLGGLRPAAMAKLPDPIPVYSPPQVLRSSAILGRLMARAIGTSGMSEVFAVFALAAYIIELAPNWLTDGSELALLQSNLSRFTRLEDLVALQEIYRG